MSITSELREWMDRTTTRFDGRRYLLGTDEELTAIADRIDAGHAELERENVELRQRVAALENRSESKHIGSATITVTPRLDWTGVTRELRSIADTLSSCNCTNDCANGERTGTCIADETETISVRGDTWGYYFDKHFTIHVMECSECGHTYEHVNGDYEYCPHCRRRVVEVNA